MATVAILGLALLAIFYSSSSDISFLKEEFHSKDWLTGDVRKRGQMVTSLLEKKILTGRTQTEVVALLGIPDNTYTNQISYKVDIGQQLGSGPWLYDLAIDFAETNGIVSNVGLKD